MKAALAPIAPFFLTALMWSSLASSETLNGPFISTESSARTPNSIKREDADRLKDAASRERWDASLFAPLYLDPSHTSLVLPRVDLAQENRHATHAPTDDAALPQEHSLSLSFGLALKDRKDWPDSLLIFKRTSDMDFAKNASVMGEVLAGMSKKNLWPIFSSSWENESSLAVRYRHFPGRETYLLLLGRTYKSPDGLTIDVLLPSYLTVTWQAPQSLWTWGASVRSDSRAFSVPQQWVDGYDVTALASARYSWTKSLALQAEAGAQMETLIFYDGEGHKTKTYQTGAGPWAKLTWQVTSEER